jgi:hypothetical protein
MQSIPKELEELKKETEKDQGNEVCGGNPLETTKKKTGKGKKREATTKLREAIKSNRVAVPIQAARVEVSVVVDRCWLMTNG